MKKPLTLAIALILALALAPAAGQAAGKKAKKNCPQNSFCVWTKPAYEGKRLVIKKFGKTNLGKAFNNKVSSAKSRFGPELAYLYDGKNASGDFRCFASGANSPNLGSEFTAFDNQGSSVLLPKDDGPVCI